MIVDPATVMAPAGEIDPAFLPDDDVSEAVRTWMEQAEAETAGIESDRVRRLAITAYVHARFFDRVHLKMSSEPARYTVDGHFTAQRLQSQIDAFREKAEDARSRYDALVGRRDEDTSTIRSQSVDVEVRAGR